jgi:hypothetical protein
MKPEPGFFSRHAGFLPAMGLIVLAAFFFARAFASGIQVADDAYFASIAKNIAFGLGYGTTVGGKGFILFDPLIGTGPVVILPAAVAIFTLGNEHWVPGLTAIFLWAFLLVLIFAAVRRADPGLAADRRRDAALMFLVGVLLVFPRHGEIWSALLGEAPAALLLLLAFACASATRLTLRTVCLASFVCSLAVLTKLLAAPGYAIVFTVFFIRLLLVEPRPKREAALWIFCSLASFTAPLVLFELVKMFSVGDVTTYLQLVRGKIAFILSRGLEGDSELNNFAVIFDRDATSRARFGISVLFVAVSTIGMVWMSFRTRRPLLIWLSLQLGAAILLLSIYFVFFSNGWPRYFVIGLILWVGLFAIAFATLNQPRRAICSIAAVALLFLVNHQKIPQLFAGFENGFFAYSDELRSALAVTELVDSVSSGEESYAKPVTPWWAATADIEYYAAKPAAFRHYSLLSPEEQFLLVYRKAYVDEKFRAARDAGFLEIKQRCGPPRFETSSHVVIPSEEIPR